MATLRVLIAEEDADIRTFVQRTLTQQGYFVVPASDGGEALRHMQNGSLDVLVASVTLPNHDGLELLRAAKEKLHPLPVILLADADRIAAAANGVRAGAFDYLTKPIEDATQLAILIERAAGQAPTPRATPFIASAAVPLAPTPAPNAEKSLGLLDMIASNADLNTLLNQFADELARATRAAHVFVLLPHNDGQLHLSASHGFTTRVEAGRMYQSAIGDKAAVQIASGKAIKWLPNASGGTMQNALGIPLMFQNRILGIAVAHETAPSETFSPMFYSAVQELALQAAIGIELARVTARANRLEPLDPVTGLYSREQFFELADRDFRRSWRFEQTMCAIVMDIDDFGTLHLTLGPQDTDQAMRRVASVVREHVRRVDIVGRLNPHTIGFSLWMAKKEHGLAVAERLRLLVAEIHVQTPDDTWQVTASFGVAAYRSTISSVFDLFGIADQALRAAKRAGRNRVEGV